MNNVINNYVSVMKKYAQFTGRAGRREYWMFLVANILISVLLGVVDGITGIPVLGILYLLAALLPSIAVSIRRLHDTDRSGWWLLAACVPIIGGLFVLVLMAMPGDEKTNRFGQQPVAEFSSMAVA